MESPQTSSPSPSPSSSPSGSPSSSGSGSFRLKRTGSFQRARCPSIEISTDKLYTTISPRALVELIDQNKNGIVIIDTRPQLLGGRIAGSFHIPFEDFEQHVTEYVASLNLKRSSRVVFVDQHGDQSSVDEASLLHNILCHDKRSDDDTSFQMPKIQVLSDGLSALFEQFSSRPDIVQLFDPSAFLDHTYILKEDVKEGVALAEQQPAGAGQHDNSLSTLAVVGEATTTLGTDQLQGRSPAELIEIQQAYIKLLGVKLALMEKQLQQERQEKEVYKKHAETLGRRLVSLEDQLHIVQQYSSTPADIRMSAATSVASGASSAGAVSAVVQDGLGQAVGNADTKTAGLSSAADTASVGSDMETSIGLEDVVLEGDECEEDEAIAAAVMMQQSSQDAQKQLASLPVPKGVRGSNANICAPNGAYRCDKCGKSYDNHSAYYYHIKYSLSHDSTNIVNWDYCEGCGKHYPKNARSKHMRCPQQQMQMPSTGSAPVPMQLSMPIPLPTQYQQQIIIEQQTSFMHPMMQLVSQIPPSSLPQPRPLSVTPTAASAPQLLASGTVPVASQSSEASRKRKRSSSDSSDAANSGDSRGTSPSLESAAASSSNSSSGTKLECKKCNQVFKSNTALNSHMRFSLQHDPKNIENWSYCSYCQKRYHPRVGTRHKSCRIAMAEAANNGKAPEELAAEDPTMETDDVADDEDGSGAAASSHHHMVTRHRDSSSRKRQSLM